jgi:tetratricopeptide (TPR) repeat protein
MSNATEELWRSAVEYLPSGLKGVAEFLLGTVQWIFSNLVLIIVLLVFLTIAALFFRLRKSILFDPWANQSDDHGLDLGRSLADLLLFGVRDIHGVHNRAPQAGLWNSYHDVPVFRYELDNEVQLVASAQLERDSALVANLISIFFRLVPLVFQPARVRGSIHRFGEVVCIYVALEDYRKRNGRRTQKLSRVWNVEIHNPGPDSYRRAVERLAHALYLELAGAGLFKSVEGFQAYTQGLERHLSFIDFREREDAVQAESLYQRASLADPDCAATQYNLAVLKYTSYTPDGNHSAAKLFRKVISTEDSRLRAEAESGLANCLCQSFHRYKTGDADALYDALTYARRAVKHARSLDSAHKALAFTCHELSEHLRKQRLERPEGRLTARRPGRRQRRSGHYRRRAVWHYWRATRENPRHYVAYNNWGNLYLNWAQGVRGAGVLAGLRRARRLRLARSKFEKAISIQPAYHHAHDNLGNAYAAEQRYAEAERSYETALEFQPGYVEARNDLAILHLSRLDGAQNPSRGWREHLAALRPLKSERERQADLCAKFSDSMPQPTTTAPGTIDLASMESPESVLQAAGCVCPLAPTRPAQPEGHILQR